jgi:hypothetical protein
MHQVQYSYCNFIISMTSTVTRTILCTVHTKTALYIHHVICSALIGNFNVDLSIQNFIDQEKSRSVQSRQFIRPLHNLQYTMKKYLFSKYMAFSTMASFTRTLIRICFARKIMSPTLFQLRG